MKRIVDIPEEAYNLLKTSGVDWLDADRILNAVANGTPLPKGHGRLIDAEKLLNTLEKLKWIRTNYSVDEDNTNILEDIINKEPTIVEADKGENK